MPTSQKADVRPISFLLHDTRSKSAITEVKFAIRPEDLTRSDQSRLSVNQTLGGAWADNWGDGVPTLTIAGHTGWGAGGMPDGLEAFKTLHRTVFAAWHVLRAQCVVNGNDPDKIKLIFSDMLDDFTWCVAPNSFVLRRNKQRPLLSQYQITMTKLSDAVIEREDKPASNVSWLGLDSLDSAIAKINEFAANLKGAIASFLGPIAAAVKAFVKLTAAVLKTVRSVIAAGTNLVRSAVGPLLDIASDLSKGAFNIMATVSALKDAPMGIKAEFMRVGAAFSNAFCLLRNVFKVQSAFPDYSTIYGASNCSSTSGGRPLSHYGRINSNVFFDLYSKGSQSVAASASGSASLKALASSDPVLAPESPSVLASLAQNVTAGVRVADSAVMA